MRLSLPPAKNPSDLLSGDQNTDTAPSVPGTTRASASSSARMKIRGGASFEVAMNASRVPSGEKAIVVVSMLEMVPPYRAPDGGGSSNRTGWGAIVRIGAARLRAQSQRVVPARAI